MKIFTLFLMVGSLYQGTSFAQSGSYTCSQKNGKLECIDENGKSIPVPKEAKGSYGMGGAQSGARMGASMGGVSSGSGNGTVKPSNEIVCDKIDKITVSCDGEIFKSTGSTISSERPFNYKGGVENEDMPIDNMNSKRQKSGKFNIKATDS